MTESMRERMARAIGAACTGGQEVLPRGNWLKAADAILDVLENPSEGVIAAGVVVDNEMEHEAPEKAVWLIFDAMIAAIREGK